MSTGEQSRRFKCPNASCSFKSISAHGLETHAAIAHQHDRRSIVSNPNKRSMRLPVPLALQGDGERLPIDRVTKQLQVDEDNCGSESVYKDLRNNIFPDTSYPIAGTTKLGRENEEEEASDFIVQAFLRVARAAGDKCCDELLKTIRENLPKCIEFFHSFFSVKCMREVCRRKVKNNLQRDGFSEITTRSSTGLQYVMYHRDPVDVLRRQINRTPDNGIIKEPSTSTTFSHPMNSLIGRVACRLARLEIMKFQATSGSDGDKSQISWCEMKEMGEQSFMGGIQLFSDKSVTSLGPGSLTFYPLHATFVNFVEEWRRNHICSGETIVAYLPVRFDNEDDGTVSLEGKSMKRVRRVQLLKSLHESIKIALQPLIQHAMCGFSALTADHRRLRAHMLLVSYIADTPEAEDMLSVKRGVKTPSPCHRCEISKTNMPFCTYAPVRCLKKTTDMINALHGDANGIIDDFKQLSMLSIMPIISSFPFIGIHECVDIYRIFRFEPMHNLSLGISKLLKECATAMLTDESRTTTSMRNVNGTARTFRNIRRSVLSLLNHFLHVTEKMSPGYGLHVDFSKGECAGRLSGLFTENGLLGMLEASDYDSIDLVSPFLGALIDVCCNLPHAPVTVSFTMYIDLVNFIYRRHLRPGWSETDLHKLGDMIRNFKDHTRRTFSSYQASGMGTSKWHALDHLVSDIRDMGGIEYLHGGLYERAHKLFKEDFRLSSKRSSSAMKQSLSKQEERTLVTRLNYQNVGHKRPNPSRLEAVRQDAAFLVKKGTRTTLLELEDVHRDLLKTGSDGPGSITPISSHVRELANSLGCDGMVTLIRLVREYFDNVGVKRSEAIHRVLEMPASAYVSGFIPPNLKNFQHGSSVFISKSSYRISQRVVAKVKFYGNQTRMDDVMVENDEKHPQLSSEDYMGIWFCKALLFIRIPGQFDKNTTSSFSCHCDGEYRCPVCSLRMQREFCFTQYYDVLNPGNLELDNIDKALGCIRLHWQRTASEKGRYTSAKQYGLVPVDSIRGLVHIVRADLALTSITNPNHRRASQFNCLRQGEEGWAGHLFYVNRFYHSAGEVYDYMDQK